MKGDAMDLKITTKKEDTKVTIAMEGEINTQTAPELNAVIEKNLPDLKTLCLDFAGCDFVSSAGLRVLLNTFKEMKKRNDKMEFINIGPNFSEVLNITGLDKVFGLK